MRLFGILLFTLISLATSAQENSKPSNVAGENVKSNKGKIYAFWGWNRGWYTNSDIHFTGDNYDFTLSDVEATDRQSPFDMGVYFGISTITIPQTNYGFGIFISEKIDIAFAVDHMKYVMVEIQETEISGKINNGNNYHGVYDNESIITDENFLKFEHTDGLNYLNFEINYNEDMLSLFKIKSKKIGIDYFIGFGLGTAMPRSNVTLMGGTRHDEFHFAGYGFSAKTGLKLCFFENFFLRTEYKAGFIDMPDIRTTPDPSDRASQHFWFTQLNFNFGFSVNLFN